MLPSRLGHLILALLLAAQGSSPLVDAAAAGDEAAVRSLLASGKALDHKDVALLAASHKGRTAVVRVLLENGANVNGPRSDRPQWTPLMIAAAEGHKETVQVLLGGGANVKARNELGRTALAYPSLYGHTEIVALLLDHGAELDARPTDGQGATALAASAMRGHTATVDLLLRRGANVNAALDNGTTPLMMASQGGHTAVVDRLLAAGAKVDTVSVGETALIIAIKEGHSDIALRLLEAGANPNGEFRGSTGIRVSVLIMSVELEREPIVAALLARGADLRYRDNEGLTALQAAKKKGNQRIVQLLQKAEK